MNRKFLVSLCWGGLLVLLSQSVWAQSKAVGVFDGQGDIGSVLHAGTSTFNSAHQSYALTGSGTNIWGTADEFQFLWKRIKGDFIVYTRGNLVGKGVDPHRKIGWMARASLDANSPQVSATVHGDGLTSLQYRRTVGATTEENRSAVSGADIIQLERRGNTFTLWAAKFGEPFQVREVTDINLGDEVYVGLFVCAHNKDVVEKADFQDVRITIPAKVGAPSGKMDLGSRLELMDVATGKRDVIFTAPNSIQAPNWTRNGKTLIYNSEGLMYSFDLARRRPAVLNTGTIKENNNDHVLAFDGKMIGLSSTVRELGGSIIYTVPVSGGTPKQITPKGPSYLHGWSPDGKDLVFCGSRNNEFDVYKIPAGGGSEIRLTDAKGLDDGPEYTPDGKYIYFNSNRTGTMQIWRMKPDGSNQEAVTKGEFHDWFAHISPDGKWMVFLSFLKEEVEAGAHPPYKHVYLRLMPVAGGQPKVIAYVYGGQGSINTPSWSPDSKRIAFVSNTDVQAISPADVAGK
ncbi:TolB family protein [Spirosoma radiotolerans]|uniref:Biopolymer transporter TolR n=1 Tax=Spirosoma radiotolerans TaxID=1379870 RepID=A0A0E3ZS02_9BACT|nr:TolB family protein [Spirosoma radiotolerans]AKD53885.1 biopolymer transporter TolR [Spirosoma radiotolerans]